MAASAGAWCSHEPSVKALASAADPEELDSGAERSGVAGDCLGNAGPWAEHGRRAFKTATAGPGDDQITARAGAGDVRLWQRSGGVHFDFIDVSPAVRNFDAQTSRIDR